MSAVMIHLYVYGFNVKNCTASFCLLSAMKLSSAIILHIYKNNWVVTLFDYSVFPYIWVTAVIVPFTCATCICKYIHCQCKFLVGDLLSGLFLPLLLTNNIYRLLNSRVVSLFTSTFLWGSVCIICIKKISYVLLVLTPYTFIYICFFSVITK